MEMIFINQYVSIKSFVILYDILERIKFMTGLFGNVY